MRSRNPFRQIIRKQLLHLLLGILIFLQSISPAFSATTTPAPPEPVAMTLAEAVFLTLRTNRNIKSAFLDRVAEKFALKVAEDKFRPDLFIDASVQYDSTRLEKIGRFSTVSGDLSPTIALKIPTGGEFAFVWENIGERVTGPMTREKSAATSLNLLFTQPLLKGGGIATNTASVKIARFTEQANILSLKFTFIDTITSAILAYWALLQAQRQLEISKQSLQRAQELLEINKALIRAGRLAKLEIVQAETDVASREFDVTAAQNTVDATRLNLLSILDIERDTLVVAVEELEITPVRLDVKQLQTLALQNRPDYLQALLQIEIAHQNLLLAKNNRLWTLSLTGAYSVFGTDPKFGTALSELEEVRGGDWNVGLILSIPFGDLTLKQGVINARVALDQGKLLEEEVRATIGIAVLDAVREVEVSLKQVALARQVRELSEKQLEIEREKLRLGLSSNFQLVRLQNDLANAQSRELAANIAYLNALTVLDQTLGTTLETWQIEIEE